MDMHRTRRWPSGDGEMVERIRDHDWSNTPLGPVSEWPQSLKTGVETMLAMPLLASLVVGPERLFLYNDLAAAHYGERHPGALGSPISRVFAHEFDRVADFYDRVFAGEAIHVPVQPLDPAKAGVEEVFDAYLTPIRGEDGAVIAALMTGFATTAQHRAEHALRESDTRNRLLIDSWTQAVWETDPAGVVVADSPSWRAHTGQTLDEWLGFGWLDAIHPEDRAFAERQWREAVAARGLVDAEFRLRAPDGSWRWTNFRAAPVLDEAGAVEKWAGINIDIDARRRAEAALRDSEGRFRAIFDSLTEACCIFDLIYDDSGHPVDLRIVDANEGYARQSGLTDVVGRLASEFMPGTEPYWIETFDRVAITGKAEQIERWHQPTGRWIHSSTARIGGPGSRRLASVFYDVTERKRAETALRESEEKYRSLFTSMDEAYAVVEVLKDDQGRWHDFRFLDANPAFMEHTGMPYPVGKTATELLGSPNPRWTKLYGEALDTGLPLRVEESEAVLGRTFDLNIFSLERERNRVAILFTDVTQRKRSEANLRESEERQAFLLKLSDALRPIRDAAQIQATTARMTAEHLGVDRAMYAEVEGEPGAERGTLRAQYVRPAGADEPPPSEFPTHFTFGTFGAHTMAARYRGEPLVVHDVEADPAYSAEDRAAWAAVQVRAAIVAELAKDGRLFGEFGVHSITPRDWTEAEVALVQQVAERTWAAAERARAEAALRASERWQQVLIEGVPQLVWRAVDEGQWTWASPQWTEFTGQAELDSHGWGWLGPVHPDDRDGIRCAWSGSADRGEFHANYRLCHAPEGRYRWFQTRATPVRDDDGAIVEWLGTSTDVDDLRRLQDRQQVLVAELQHRVRNILTVVRSVFARTMESGGDPDELTDHYRGRLDSLARTQVIVTQSATGLVDLETLIRDELLSFGVDGGRSLSISGPDVALPPVAAESFGLAIHELTVNALKYGALKVSDGRIRIRWRINMDYGEARRLCFIWDEQGVPAMPINPVRKGFGSELIEQALPYRLDAQARLEFRSGGVRCTIDLPLPAGATWAEPEPER